MEEKINKIFLKWKISSQDTCNTWYYKYVRKLQNKQNPDNLSLPVLGPKTESTISYVVSS